MGAYNLPPELARQLAALAERVAVLERRQPEPIHYIGAAGEPAFQNSWVNNDNGLASPGGGTQRDAGFYRDAGRVHLTGIIRSGTMATTAFALPIGYRPVRSDSYHPAVSNGLFGAAIISGTTGAVLIAVGSNAYFTLDGISFRHA